jgi:hypothetical protein
MTETTIYAIAALDCLMLAWYSDVLQIDRLYQFGGNIGTLYRSYDWVYYRILGFVSAIVFILLACLYETN